MTYTAEELNRIHETEIEILQEIIRVCEENNIAYFIFGGALLGLIRHDGFIPWDDDIDLGMMRADYNRFLEIAPKALKKGYFLQHYSTEPNTPTYHTKVRKDNTLFVEESYKNMDIHKGIFVDIMPFDYIPENEKERSKFTRRASIAAKMLEYKCFIYKSKKDQKIFLKRIKRLIKTIIHLCLIPFSKKYLFLRFDHILQEYNNKPSKLIGSRGIITYYYWCNDIFPLVKRKFENVPVWSPNHPDAILTTEFGDWRQLPPEDKRYAHLPVELKF